MLFCMEQKSILPEYPVFLDGYNKKRIANESFLDVICSCSIFNFSGDNFVFISLDLMGIYAKDSLYLKTSISRIFSIPIENIIIYTIHSHSSVAFLGGRTVEKSLVDPNYIRFLEDVIVELVDYCLMHLKQVEVKISKFKVCDVYGDRNVENENTCDDVVQIFMQDYCKTIASFLSLRTHPTILDSNYNKVSSDLFGAIRNKFDHKVQIINGACGNISTRFFRNSNDENQVLSSADKFFEQVSFDLFDYDVDLLDCSIVKVNVDYNPKKDEFLCSKVQELVNSTESYAPFLLEKLNERYHLDRISFSFLARVFDMKSFFLICVPGELVTNLEMRVKNAARKDVIFCCYCDDYIGYLVDNVDYGKYFETYRTLLPKYESDKFIDMIINIVK